LSVHYKSGRIWSAVFQFMLLILSLLCIFPLVLVLSISLSSEESVKSDGYSLIPKDFSFYAYKYIFLQADDLLHAYGVTITITAIGTAMSLLLTTMLAYPIARKSFMLSKFIAFFVFFTMLFNGGLVTTYILMTRYLQLKDSLWALIIPMLIAPFHVLLLRNFFATIPDSLVESAKIDGASEYRILFQIMVPLALPGLATISLFTMLGYWNQWFESMMYMNDDQKITLQYFLQRMLSTVEYINQSANPQVKMMAFPKESARMAMCILAIGPIVFVYPFFQKFYVRGLTIGAVKQ